MKLTGHITKYASEPFLNFTMIPLFAIGVETRKMGHKHYNSVTRAPIKTLSPLFTLQLLILPTRDPFYAQKS